MTSKLADLTHPPGPFLVQRDLTMEALASMYYGARAVATRATSACHTDQIFSGSQIGLGLAYIL